MAATTATSSELSSQRCESPTTPIKKAAAASSKENTSIYYSLISKNQIEDLKQKLNVKKPLLNAESNLLLSNSSPAPHQTSSASTTPTKASSKSSKVSLKRKRSISATVEPSTKSSKASDDNGDSCSSEKSGQMETVPCKPGTNILLEGIIWNETSKGVLVLNVTWRGKSFVGTLFDSSKSSWEPPCFKESICSKVKAVPFVAASSASSASSSSSNYYYNGKDNSLYYGSQSIFLDNILCSDPTVRTLRNGKRRYITNRFENEMMSDLEMEFCNASADAKEVARSQQIATPTPSHNNLSENEGNNCKVSSNASNCSYKSSSSSCSSASNKELSEKKAKKIKQTVKAKS